MSRELSKQRRVGASGQKLLSDLGRLPLEAAVDMVCAGLDALPTRGGSSGGPLGELVARIETTAHEDPHRAAAAAA
ncbi:MAG: hypothetical protein KC502_11985, partial [Myxococcales bacterium]|nr:hypothetical protein [Myxococcales bacterium]